MCCFGLNRTDYALLTLLTFTMTIGLPAHYYFCHVLLVFGISMIVYGIRTKKILKYFCFTTICTMSLILTHVVLTGGNHLLTIQVCMCRMEQFGYGKYLDGGLWGVGNCPFILL